MPTCMMYFHNQHISQWLWINGLIKVKPCRNRIAGTICDFLQTCQCFDTRRSHWNPFFCRQNQDTKLLLHWTIAMLSMPCSTLDSIILYYMVIYIVNLWPMMLWPTDPYENSQLLRLQHPAKNKRHIKSISKYHIPSGYV